MTPSSLGPVPLLKVRSGGVSARFSPPPAEKNNPQLFIAKGLLTHRYFEPLSKAIYELLDTSQKKTVTGPKPDFMKRIASLDSETLAYLSCSVLLKHLSHSVPFLKVALEVGEAIEAEQQMRQYARLSPGVYRGLSKQLASPIPNPHVQRYVITQVMKAKHIEWQAWDKGIKIQVGSVLIETFLKSTRLMEAKLTQKGALKRKVLEPTVQTLQFLEEVSQKNNPFSFGGPLLEPPSDWTSPWSKDSQRVPLKLVKSHTKRQDRILTTWDMPAIYQGVRALQRTPYAINKRVLEVAATLWDRECPLAGLPKKFETTSLSKQEKKAPGFRQRLSKNIETRLILQEATAFKEASAFYFPHTLDFRGRVYPVCQYLNPQGNDLSRGLLTFSENAAKPLGNNGACWLAIHGANCWGEGLDKTSLQNRIDWVLSHEGQILSATQSPQENFWWTKAKSPWQFLAFCFEWAGYQQEGEEYLCSLPVAIDGTNNALQHFAALQRCPVLGKGTNLLPSPHPQDIYQEVCEEVNCLVQEEAIQGNIYAQGWRGHITRSTVKRPVMTHTYGAQEYGFLTQIMEDTLKPWKLSGKPYPFDDHEWEAALYLAKLLKKAIAEKVSAAEVCMSWLRDVAHFYAQHNLPLQWVSPAGFPVVQAYPKYKTKRVKTHLSGRFNYSVPTDQVDRVKQVNGICANFIHSLDSAALFLTIRLGLANGIQEFRMIHDSYACVPADLETLNLCARQAFVNMYQDNLLEGFREDVASIWDQTTLKNREKDIPHPPSLKNLPLKEALNSDYFFS